VASEQAIRWWSSRMTSGSLNHGSW
jgi:hypothetical protein